MKDMKTSFKDMQQGEAGKTMKAKKNHCQSLGKRINWSLVLLVPWASNFFSFWARRNVHLFHLGFVYSLAQLFDFPDRFFGQSEVDVEIDSVNEDPPN
jgi:hypothetical protein